MKARYSPWILKQRPVGDWVIDRLNRDTMTVQRWGTYEDRQLAEDVYRSLNAPKNGKEV